MFISMDDTSVCFKGFTLIMPAVSVGNVGQLAVDLIISSLNLQSCGYLHSDCLIPVVGNNPYSTNNQDSVQLCTSAEVYCSSDLRLAVLQIRSPILQSKIRSFRKMIVSWIKSNGFSRTVLLSSSYAHQRDDRQLHGSQLRYLLTPSLQKEDGALKQLGWRQMEKVSAFPGVTDSDRQRLYIPGGGATKTLYNECCMENVPMAVLLLFCSEGDNIPDSFTLANHLNEWLHILDKTAQGLVPWRVPSSWNLLFGSGIPPMIF